MILFKVMKEKESGLSNILRLDHKETIGLNEREEVSCSTLDLEVIDSHWNIFLPDKLWRNESAVILDGVEIVLISVLAGPRNDVLSLFRRKSSVLLHDLLVKGDVLVVIATSLTVRNAESVYQYLEFLFVVQILNYIPLIVHVVIKNYVVVVLLELFVKSLHIPDLFAGCGIYLVGRIVLADVFFQYW